ncbi:hypothetical protein [Actinokineospora enzanensis]|uniref:hypothetical protein n=1 Tax=Actinokineospora enzanensis TaxID=155975 RepID=UPI000380B4FD|nr:hypothetical protein [Actinokineospora enzanensis]
MRTLSKGMAAVAIATGVLVPVSIATATPAAAQSNCRAGTWGGIYGWGECGGQGRWQLKVSCTWGGDATSSVLSGPGHVDVRCPWGSARNASIIYL